MKIPRSRIAVTILVLFLVSFSEAPRTFAKINFSWINAITSGNLGMHYRQATTPRAGEFVLPPVVQSGISLLRANRAQEYCFSPAFGINTEIRDRFVEGAYPLSYKKNAPYQLFLARESPDPKCTHVSREGGVVLAYCP